MTVTAWCDVCASPLVVSTRKGLHGSVMHLCAIHWERDHNRKQQIRSLERALKRNGFVEVGATT